jgi:hypothetical protein
MTWRSSPDDGHIDVTKQVESKNRLTWKRNVRQVGYLQEFYPDARPIKHKIANT